MLNSVNLKFNIEQQKKDADEKREHQKGMPEQCIIDNQREKKLAMLY
jgi:hypothetical protein